MAYQKLAALPRPSMPGDPPRLQGVRVGRFRLDLHDYEEWQGDVGIRVSSLGEKAIEHMRKSGETSNSEGVSQLVQNIGREAFELTRAIAYDTRSRAAASRAREKLVEAGLMKPKRKKSLLDKDIPTGSAQGHAAQRPRGSSAEDILSNEDEEAQIPVIKGLDTVAFTSKPERWKMGRTMTGRL